MMMGISFIATARKASSKSSSFSRKRSAYLKTLRSKNKYISEEDPYLEEVLLEIKECLAKENYSTSSLDCPECCKTMKKLVVDGIEIDHCLLCKSFWLDKGELKSYTGMLNEVPGVDYASRLSRYECPICHEKMREYSFKPPFNLLVDICLQEHGTYLENNELNRAFEISKK